MNYLSHHVNSITHLPIIRSHSDGRSASYLQMNKVINQLRNENSSLYLKIINLKKEKNLDLEQAKPKFLIEENEELNLITAAEFIKDNDQDALILN